MQMKTIMRYNKCWRGCGEKRRLLYWWWKCKPVQLLWKSHSITYTRNLKQDTNELIYKTETDSQTQKANLKLPKSKRCGRISYEFEISRYKLLHIKKTTRSYYRSTGNYIQYCVRNYNGKEYERKNIYLNHFAAYQQLTLKNQLCFNKNPLKKKKESSFLPRKIQL